MPDHDDSCASGTTHPRPSSFVGPTVRGLQTRVLVEHSSEAKTVLARLRAATAGEPGTAWAINEYLMPKHECFETAVCSDDPNAESADYAETAIHVAMTSYASLQQTTDKPMHVDGRSLGTAARHLAAHPGERMGRGRVWGRFAKLAQAQTVSELRWQLRGFMSLLQRRSIGLDIALLADDVYFWQCRTTRARVQRVWSRAYFHAGAPAD